MQDAQDLHKYPSKSHTAKKKGQLETMLKTVEDKDKESHDGGGWKLVNSGSTSWSYRTDLVPWKWVGKNKLSLGRCQSQLNQVSAPKEKCVS